MFNIITFFSILCICIGIAALISNVDRIKIIRRNDISSVLIKRKWWHNWTIYSVGSDSKCTDNDIKTVENAISELPMSTIFYKLDWSVGAKKNMRPNMSGTFAIYQRNHIFARWKEVQRYADYNWAKRDYERLIQ